MYLYSTVFNNKLQLGKIFDRLPGGFFFFSEMAISAFRFHGKQPQMDDFSKISDVHLAINTGLTSTVFNVVLVLH